MNVNEMLNFTSEHEVLLSVSLVRLRFLWSSGGLDFETVLRGVRFIFPAVTYRESCPTALACH